MFLKTSLRTLALSLVLALPLHSYASEPPESEIEEIVTPGADDDEIYTVWTRVRDGFKIPNMENSVVDENLAKYSKRPDYLQRMANRSQKYLYHIIEEVTARGMPTEIALLPFVESAFVTNAKSRVKAAGLWQFMPATGKHYELDQTMWKDERYDVLQSTSAALTYLQRLHDEFNDWPLAFAAYNWGEGNVRRAIKRNQSLGLPTDYMSLKMPSETRNYYPKLQAIKNIVQNPNDYGIKLPTIYNEPFFVQIFKDQDIDVKRAANLAGMSHEEFSTLNPSFNRPVIVASHNHSMLMPTDKLDQFIENLVAYRTSGKPLSSWTTYRVKPEDTVASIARKAHMTETALREANQIPAGRRIKPGSLVLVSKASGLGNAEDISSDTIDASFALAQDYRRVTYRVRRGDNMRSVARRLGVSPATIMKSNGLRSQRLRVGQTLRVNVPIVTRQTTSSRPSTARNTPDTPVASTKFYVVRKGDTLYSIANRYGISASALRNANNISGNNISVGQRLTINASGTPTKRHVVLEEVPAKLQKQVNKRPLANKATYKVRKGDTLFSIASSANMSVNQLKKLNGIRNNNLKVGQTLKLAQ
ncbi:LysM peptidoglycan-binding domain-containing protein [uncultured Parasutterella sp.]|jgi:membrane-bound lytic murein transglycosylase D|uniref:LysM peptidoglycan-binding domain-containing protein n=1 Tax=uncultured Parasutterella sp. TaxID=1263098 RepID=UPI0025EC1B71|nr:LysM peptidoglycan-binding domain-containing protein [uncultured Parasutterella sp.]